jgi:hypothetical protein
MRQTEDGLRPVIFETVGEIAYEGRVLDGPTGKPMADVLVYPSHTPPPLNALSFTDEQWVKLRALSLEDLRKIGSGKIAPEMQSLDSLRTFVSFSSIARTDRDGRYRIRAGFTRIAGDGTREIPDLRLSPSAIVAFKPVASRRLQLQLYLIGDRQGFLSYGPTYFRTEMAPPRMPKVPTPPIPMAMMAPRPYMQIREDGRVVATDASPVWTNEVCRFPVPAGMLMGVELRERQHATDPSESVRPVVLAERIILKPGEVLDVGEVAIESRGQQPDQPRQKAGK